MGSLLKQAREEQSVRKPRMLAEDKQRHEGVLLAEPRLVNQSDLIALGREVFVELAGEVPAHHRTATPKIELIPVATVLTHQTRSLWRRAVQSMINAYLDEVQNRQRAGRWVLVGFEIEVEQRIHRRYYNQGHNKSALGNLANGQIGIAPGKNLEFHEQLGYLVIVMQAGDVRNAERTVWKNNQISTEENIGADIARALREGNLGDSRLSVELERERERAENLEARLSATTSEMTDLKAMFGEVMAALREGTDIPRPVPVANIPDEVEVVAAEKEAVLAVESPDERADRMESERNARSAEARAAAARREEDEKAKAEQEAALKRKLAAKKGATTRRKNRTAKAKRKEAEEEAEEEVVVTSGSAVDAALADLDDE